MNRLALALLLLAVPAAVADEMPLTGCVTDGAGWFDCPDPPHSTLEKHAPELSAHCDFDHLVAALRKARAHLIPSSATVASHPVGRTPGMEFAEADALEARDRDLAEIDTTLAACEPKETP